MVEAGYQRDIRNLQHRITIKTACTFSPPVLHYTAVKREFFRAGCNSLLAVKSATLCQSLAQADSVKLRDQQYRLDERRKKVCFCMVSPWVSLYAQGFLILEEIR